MLELSSIKQSWKNSKQPTDSRQQQRLDYTPGILRLCMQPKGSEDKWSSEIVLEPGSFDVVYPGTSYSEGLRIPKGSEDTEKREKAETSEQPAGQQSIFLFQLLKSLHFTSKK